MTINANIKSDPLREPVLILNANFEPLHVSTTKRALGLLFSGKAEVIINGRGYIHSATAKFGIPSIIRLSHMIRRPRPRVNLTKREIMRRDNFTCQYCGSNTSILTIDHVIPRHSGGQHRWENVVAACQTCNRRKGGLTPEQANMPLRHAPREPKPTALYRFSKYLNQREEWNQFLNGW